MHIKVPYNTVLYKIVSFTGQQIIKVAEIILTKFSNNNSIIFKPSTFNWVSNLESSTPIILSELKEILKKYSDIPEISEISEEQKRIVDGKNWKTFFLYAYGEKIKGNCRLCPQTTQLINTIPGMTTAFFSILEPHTCITEHRGPYKGVLRYHLGLIIPPCKELCYIKIENEKYNWEYGKSLIFDDTVPHEVKNETEEIRVVLFIDFKRQYPIPINLFNNGLIFLIRKSPFVSNILSNINERPYKNNGI